jgi:hypothetical protein
LKDKNEFVKNKYKFNEVKSTSVGHYSKGVLNLSKFDLEKINGKRKNEEDDDNKGRKGGKIFKKNKSFKKKGGTSTGKGKKGGKRH